MKEEIENWERDNGIKYFKKIGIKVGQPVLDFGARIGHYSIPASIVVGNSGLVYAIDKDQDSLNDLQQKVRTLGLDNIRVINNSGNTKLNLGNKTIDAVLLYDVLHYFKKDERKNLYAEIYQLLKPDGLLSIYPKHVIEDYPLMEFQNIHIDDVKKEIAQIKN